jgi:hypothetical protein
MEYRNQDRTCDQKQVRCDHGDTPLGPQLEEKTDFAPSQLKAMKQRLIVPIIAHQIKQASEFACSH